MMMIGMGVTGYNRPVMWGCSGEPRLLDRPVPLGHADLRDPPPHQRDLARPRPARRRGDDRLHPDGGRTLSRSSTSGGTGASTTILPYPNSRELWPNLRSPLMWDAVAINTYLLGSLTFLYFGMIPDLAIARDHATGWRRKFYSVLALGFRGTHNAVAAVPRRLDASSRSSSSRSPSRSTRSSAGTSPWRRSPGGTARSSPPTSSRARSSRGSPGWCIVMAILRKAFRLEKRPHAGSVRQSRKAPVHHVPPVGLLLLHRVPHRLVQPQSGGVGSLLAPTAGPYLPLFLTMIVCNFVIPFPMLCMRRVRRSIPDPRASPPSSS